MLSLLLILSYTFCITSFEEECNRNFSVRKNSIILTKASQSKGASFIHKQVVSIFSECYSLCCSNAECTVAVYENKINHICFMFNCKEPNVCLFTEHEDYMSMLLIPDQKTPHPNVPIKESVIRNNVLIRPSIDAALGESCGNMRKCGPANSMCTSATCICQQRFIGRSGQCVRSLCPKPELMFQCFDVSKSPFCVAIYDQCNGVSECGDSSDELNCEVRRQNFNESSNSRAVVIKPNPKPKTASHQLRNDLPSTSKYHSRDRTHKAPLSVHKSNDSRLHPNVHKNQFQSNAKFPKDNGKNPLAENQLLLLEAKNKPPKSPRRRIKVASIAPENNRNNNNNLNEKHPYSKYKSPSYQRVNKVDEYYQKGSPSDQSDISTGSRWTSGDSGQPSNDYEYSSQNNRDSSNDWPDNDQYVEPSYAGESTGKYSSDRNGDSGYYPYYEEDSYSKPRGRFISDSDRYRPKFGYEQSMDSGNSRKDVQSGRHRIFVNLPKPGEAAHAPSSAPMVLASERAPLNDGRNMAEWDTAVVALSLGLLVSAGLLIAVGLKMRTWRRRLRPGKKGGRGLTTDEGDYLINGMYL